MVWYIYFAVKLHKIWFFYETREKRKYINLRNIESRRGYRSVEANRSLTNLQNIRILDGHINDIDTPQIRCMVHRIGSQLLTVIENIDRRAVWYMRYKNKYARTFFFIWFYRWFWCTIFFWQNLSNAWIIVWILKTLSKKILFSIRFCALFFNIYFYLASPKFFCVIFDV